MAWSQDDSVVYGAGERGMIQGWHVSTFECVLTISLRSRMVRHEIVIWSICTLPYLFAPSHVPYPARDGTIVSGDSLGKMKFWNSRDGTLIQVTISHR